MSDITNLMDRLNTVRNNPSMMQRLVLNLLEETTGGKRLVVDPTNPFVFLMESSAVNASAGMVEAAALTRKQYASMAQTEDELYMHMSDRDYVGRFANPGRAVINLALSKEEIQTRAVDTGVAGIRKLVIPRNTEYTVGAVKFTMQYPVEVRIMGHGGLQVVYNVERPSPLQSLASNEVPWRIATYGTTEYVVLQIPVQQIEITPTYAKLNASTVFNQTYDLKDEFHYARVYMATPNGEWEEIATTHTDQVFDASKPTALLRHYQKSLRVSIPQVYFTTGLLDSELRIDIYTTKGPLDLRLDSYEPNAYSARWVDLATDEDRPYIAPLAVFTTMAVWSDSTVTGGTLPLGFEALRQRVLTNSMGNNQTPITNVQIQSYIENLGYRTVANVDNITNRVFLATRRMPTPTNAAVTTGAAVSIKTLETTLSFLQQQPTVRDNGERMTVLPSTLYVDQGGRLGLVPDFQVQELKKRALDLIATTVNDNQYLYTPFYYVLDSTEDTFECRPYHLDSPEVEAKVFVEENSTVGLEISTGEFEVAKTDTGYKLVVKCKSGAGWKGLKDEEVYAQLHFSPVGESARAYQNGVQTAVVDDERVFEFQLDTNYDITSGNSLAITSFIMYNEETRTYYTDLFGDFDLVYGVVNYDNPDMLESNIDLVSNQTLLPEGSRGVVQERFRIRFGWALEGLWANSRSVVSSVEYLRYEVDIPAVYAANVYELDPVTQKPLLSYQPNGKLGYTIVHRAGDPRLDAETGEQIMDHEAGELIRDPVTGDPIVTNPRGMLRQVDLFMVDGGYYFATEPRTVAYRKQLPETVVSWINEDVAGVNSLLLEQTKLYFYPQSTQGLIDAVVREGAAVSLTAQQSLKVTYYLTKLGYTNSELLQALTTMTATTIATELELATVTVDDLEAKLRAQAGTDVIAIRVTGLGGSQNLASVLIKDDSVRLSIRQKLVARPDASLMVQDDIDVVFIRHEALTA